MGEIYASNETKLKSKIPETDVKEFVSVDET